MRELLLRTAGERAAPLRGLRVLLYGFSGRGFPGGDGVAEAVEILPLLGVEAVYTHESDPELPGKLEGTYDVAIICNTRIGALLAAPRRLWKAAPVRSLWFWDLRPGSVGAPLAGLVDRVFLAYRGRWTAPNGAIYDPAQWASELRCPVSYAPQGTSLRTPDRQPGHPRIAFVGDVANQTYHTGRAELCRTVGAVVMNRKAREDRLALEARLPEIYRSSRYVLSTSPRAPGYTSVRTYSILACGGLLALHRFPDCERLFEDGKHAVLFDTPSELIERLKVLDGDDYARDQIADAGRELHAGRHTITHRILGICREALGIDMEFPGWL